MSVSKRPRPPAGLGSAGRGLWHRMHAALADHMRFSVHEVELLGRACRITDREAKLRELLERDGLLSEGSKGQPVLHPALQELRAMEAQVLSLLGRVSVEDTGGSTIKPTARRAAVAARARWDHERDELAAKRKAAGLDG